MGFFEGGIRAIGKRIAGLADPLFGAASGTTNVLKSVVDGEVRRQLEEVRDQEGCPHIHACCDYAMSNQQINAMKAAADGNTAWEAPNLLWVYHGQVDYAPMHARQVYHLREDGRWEGQGGQWRRPITGVPCHRCTAVRAARMISETDDSRVTQLPRSRVRSGSRSAVRARIR
jgi:hypothetical protein